ncbi:MAG: DUF3048 domain-containing protein [Chloroflexota bacterium]
MTLLSWTNLHPSGHGPLRLAYHFCNPAILFRWITSKKAQFLWFIMLATFILVACSGNRAEPTPTPTKTPIQAAQVIVEATHTSPPPELPTQTATPTIVEPTSTPTALPDNIAPYTGLTVDDVSRLQQRPIIVCINNDTVGRNAHFGLGLADIVYEYIVDGFTITRLTAIYHSQHITRSGPVRSARFPNVWMAYMYDGVLACSGGTDEIRYILKNEVAFPYLDADIDDPTNNRYFQSLGTDYRTRMQISTDGVYRWLADTGKSSAGWSRSGFEYSQDPPPSAGSTATMQIRYPGGNSVEWRYDANLGGYLRWQGGEQQNDPATSSPILAKNVIVMSAVHEETDIVEDSLGTKSIDIQLYGFGDLRIFRDGQVYEGTWRADPENPPRWLGPGDAIIKLKPGQSWIQVVRDRGELSY